jgi:NAD(P)H-nitrite reductase large subunit
MHVIVIGSGVGGITFAEKYRELAPDDQITLLTQESDGYYSRPMLSLGFSRDGVEQSIILKPFSKLLEKNICVINGVKVTGIDRTRRTVLIAGMDAMERLNYDRLLLATGSAALIPPSFQAYRDCFFVLNSLQDLLRLRQFRQAFLDQNKTAHWAIVGGGLIGCEVASDLAYSGDKVTLYHAMDRLMERQLVDEDSALLLKIMQTAGIKVLLDQTVRGFQRKQNMQVTVNVEGQANADFDAVILACGFKPRIDLAVKASLETGRGIKVNQYLQTSDEAVYALGDVAELPNGKLYAYILPIRNQALWLAHYLTGQGHSPWSPPTFNPKAKVHHFEATKPYNF